MAGARAIFSLKSENAVIC